jgi:hypothetical protein
MGGIMMKRQIKYPAMLISIISLVVGFSQPLHAVAPETKGQLAQSNDPDYLPRLGTYFYCFEFNSVNIGKASIGIEREGDLYRMQVNAKTNEKIDYVYKIRYRGENLTDLDSLVPVETKIKQQVKSTEKEFVIKFQDNGTIQTSEKKFKKGEIVDGEVRKFHTDRYIVDPFSATYLARGLDWKVGTEQVFEVYTGKSRYELRLKCTDKTLVERSGGKREAWVIVPTAKALDPDKLNAAAKKKPADIKIYLSADELRDVLRIEANHTMGTFLVFLDRFEAAPVQRKLSSVQSIVPVNAGL